MAGILQQKKTAKNENYLAKRVIQSYIRTP